MPSNPPTILAFDTSAAHFAAVLLRDGDIIVERHEELGRTQVERLMPLLEEVLAAAGNTWKDLSAVTVCTGPGNFTGTRIGVSAARGLAMSLKIPAIGVSCFDAAALAADIRSGETVSINIPLLRDQYGLQVFASGHPPVALSSPSISASKANASDFSIRDIARFAALVIAKDTDIPRPAPLYLRPADAAPAKDKPPVILDDA